MKRSLYIIIGAMSIVLIGAKFEYKHPLSKSDMLFDDSGALVSLDYIHYRVHTGVMCQIVFDTTLSANDSAYVLITTPSTRDVHFVGALSCNNSGSFALYETPTTDGGASLTAYNMKRSVASPCLTTFKSTPVVGSTGTLLSKIYIGTNSPGTKIGGAVRTGAEWLLARSSTYLIVFGADNNNTKICILTNTYEEQ